MSFPLWESVAENWGTKIGKRLVRQEAKWGNFTIEGRGIERLVLQHAPPTKYRREAGVYVFWLT